METFFVYLGAEMAHGPDGPLRSHVFQYARSFHRDGNWNEMTDGELQEWQARTR